MRRISVPIILVNVDPLNNKKQVTTPPPPIQVTSVKNKNKNRKHSQRQEYQLVRGIISVPGIEVPTYMLIF